MKTSAETLIALHAEERTYAGTEKKRTCNITSVASILCSGPIAGFQCWNGVEGMLILTRKSGETIRIGDDVAVSVIEIRGNQVRLGISAPRDVMVHREEVYELIQDQNKQAAEVSAIDKALVQSLWQKKSAGKSPKSGGPSKS